MNNCGLLWMLCCCVWIVEVLWWFILILLRLSMFKWCGNVWWVSLRYWLVNMFLYRKRSVVCYLWKFMIKWVKCWLVLSLCWVFCRENVLNCFWFKYFLVELMKLLIVCLILFVIYFVVCVFWCLMILVWC